MSQISEKTPLAAAPELGAASGAVLEGLGFAVIFFIVSGLPILAIEVASLTRSGRMTRGRLAGMATSFFCFVPATGFELALGGALLSGFALVARLSPLAIETGWLSAAVCLALVDFIYYWEHRAGHQVNLLWSAYHSVHHSADHFDQSVAYRVSFADLLFVPAFYLPLAVIGFDPLLILTCAALVAAYQTWAHTETIGALPLLDGWLNTPANHRVHHGRNAAYIDKNYGGILMIWDRIFGTYARETEAVDYGLIEPLQSRSPVAVHFHALGKLFQNLRLAGSVRRAAGLAFGKPGASPVAPPPLSKS